MKPFNAESLRRRLPPNTDPAQMAATIRLWLIATAVVGAVLFAIRYTGSYNQLFYYVEGVRYLLPGQTILPFWSAAGRIAFLGGVQALMALLLPLQLYGSFSKSSRSIYLMRRLPDGGRTLRRMVMEVPLRWLAWTAAETLLLLGGAYLIWRFVTPAACLPI